MRKVLITLLFVTIAVLGYTPVKNQFKAYHLTKILTSDAEVARIKASQNEPYDFSTTPVFMNEAIESILPNKKLLSYINEAKRINSSNVLGTESDRWIEIDLSDQRLKAWEGGNEVYSYLVSTGKWAPTPTGDYNIWIKLEKTKMSGGSKALGTYYYLPNVPCVMYFYQGYGIHGAYWHNNFGQPMSHGCVNMRPDEACTLFAWASVGTRVNIHQ